MNISGKCQDFIRELGNDAQYNLRRFNDRLNDQLSSSFDASSSRPQFSAPILPDMTDYNDGLKTAALVLLPFSAPLAIAAGVLSFFFESKSEKIRKQKNKLRSALNESRDDIIPKVMSQLIDIINERIHRGMIGGFSDNLIARGELLWNSAQAQEKIADTINEQYRNLNFENLIEALDHIDNPRGLGSIVTARSFGEELAVFSTTLMLEDTRQELSKLLGEKVRAFEYTKDNFADDVRNIIRRNSFSRPLRQQLLWSPTGEV